MVRMQYKLKTEKYRRVVGSALPLAGVRTESSQNRNLLDCHGCRFGDESETLNFVASMSPRSWTNPLATWPGVGPPRASLLNPRLCHLHQMTLSSALISPGNQGDFAFRESLLLLSHPVMS